MATLPKTRDWTCPECGQTVPIGLTLMRMDPSGFTAQGVQYATTVVKIDDLDLRAHLLMHEEQEKGT